MLDSSLKLDSGRHLVIVNDCVIQGLIERGERRLGDLGGLHCHPRLIIAASRLGPQQFASFVALVL